MGRKKRAVHPWSRQELAQTECTKALGANAASDGISAFVVAAKPSRWGALDSDTYTRRVADLLIAVEQKHGVKVTGRLATLLWIAGGATQLRSEDRFEQYRKTWDESLRRARKGEPVFGGPGIATASMESLHDSEGYAELVLYRPRPPPSAAQLRSMLGFELEELARAAERAPARKLNSLIEGVRKLRKSVKRVKPD